MGNRLDAGTRRRIYKRDGGKCQYCAKRLATRFHVDHKVPRASGGTDDDGNLQLVCIACNGRKGKLSHDEYKDKLERTRKWARTLAKVRELQKLAD